MAISENKPPIGIFGGTFDPVHMGHLRPSLEVCEMLGMEQVRFIPAFTPPHRDTPATSVKMRLEMVKRAIASESRFVLDEREIDRGGASYMVDTLASLRMDFPEHPLCLLMGLDAFLQLHRWHRWSNLLDYAHIIVSRRPQCDSSDETGWPPEIRQYYQQFKALDQKDIICSLQGKILFANITQLSISATDIRERLKNNQSIRYLVPEAVLDLIEYRQLYK